MIEKSKIPNGLELRLIEAEDIIPNHDHCVEYEGLTVTLDKFEKALTDKSSGGWGIHINPKYYEVAKLNLVDLAFYKENILCYVKSGITGGNYAATKLIEKHKVDISFPPSIYQGVFLDILKDIMPENKKFFLKIDNIGRDGFIGINPEYYLFIDEVLPDCYGSTSSQEFAVFNIESKEQLSDFFQRFWSKSYDEDKIGSPAYYDTDFYLFGIDDDRKSYSNLKGMLLDLANSRRSRVIFERVVVPKNGLFAAYNLGDGSKMRIACDDGTLENLRKRVSMVKQG